MSSSADLAVVRVPVIVGPTGAGKSGLALALARELGAHLISADSRQVYRGFDIGTAKPTRLEQEEAPHAGIDIASPEDRVSAADWAQAAVGWIAHARAVNRIPLVVGGTGFYVRALAAPLFDAPPLDPRRRAALDAVLSTRDLQELRRWARALDPARAHLGRTQLLRAIETALLTGHRMSALHRTLARAGHVAPRYLVVDPGRSLAQRLTSRLDAMLRDGWVAEVARLMSQVPSHAPAWTSTGYDAVRRHLLGEFSLEEARERVLIATRQYAKRQRTWFRHQLVDGPVTHIDPTAADALDQARRWLENR